MNAGALLTGAAAAAGGYAWLQVLHRELAARAEDDPGDDLEPHEREGPFRFFSTTYLRVQRAVAWGIVGVGVVLFVLALFS